MSSSWENTLLFHCVCIYIHWETVEKLYWPFFFFPSPLGSDWKTKLSAIFLLVIIRFHKAYMELSVAGWPLKHQVKSPLIDFYFFKCNPYDNTLIGNAAQLVVCCFQGDGVRRAMSCDYNPAASYCSKVSLNFVYFSTSLGCYFAHEKTDSVSITNVCIFPKSYLIWPAEEPCPRWVLIQFSLCCALPRSESGPVRENNCNSLLSFRFYK